MHLEYDKYLIYNSFWICSDSELTFARRNIGRIIFWELLDELSLSHLFLSIAAARTTWWFFPVHISVHIIRPSNCPLSLSFRSIILISMATRGSKARFRRRTSHEPNRMLMRENKGFFSFAFDSAHVKYGVWSWPKGLILSHFLALFSLFPPSLFPPHEPVLFFYIYMYVFFSARRYCMCSERNQFFLEL